MRKRKSVNPRGTVRLDKITVQSLHKAQINAHTLRQYKRAIKKKRRQHPRDCFETTHPTRAQAKREEIQWYS